MTTNNFIKAVIFAVLSAVLSTPLQILNSIFVLQEAAPPEISFLIPIGIIGIIMKTLYATAYVLTGKNLPVHSPRLRAFVFIVIIWVSDYLPQVLGLMGADGPIAEAAFSLPLIACDTVSYVIDVVLLGFLYKNLPYCERKQCSNSALVKAMMVSAFLFPILVFVVEQIMGFFYSPLYVFNAMKVSYEKIIPFTITFYGCFIITGALLPVIYRYTEFNTGNRLSSLKFGVIYSFCLWAPVVLIMVAFGTDILITCIYIIVFAFCIITVAKINDHLITKYSCV